MKYLVFSDIHGNLESFEEILEEAETIHPDMIISLGDVVGYGADPGKCIELVEKYAQIKICGNHDLAAAGLISTADFNDTARECIRWTSDILNKNQIEALKKYEPTHHYGDCLFSHASPLSPLKWEYIVDISQATKIFKHFGEKFIFIGHTHIPGIISYEEKGGAKIIRNTLTHINPKKRYLINTGSVGQSRDGMSAGSFTVLDTVRGIINQRRVKYDFTPTQGKILAAGLPGILASRLETGE